MVARTTRQADCSIGANRLRAQEMKYAHQLKCRYGKSPVARRAPGRLSSYLYRPSATAIQAMLESGTFTPLASVPIPKRLSIQ